MVPRNRKEIDSPFSGPLRHYHRANVQAPKSWEEWIEGKPPSRKSGSQWISAVLAILGVIALAAVGIGLFVEMR